MPGLTRRGLDEGLDPQELIDRAMIPAMAEAGRRFEDDVFFVPELLSAGRAITAALDVLRPLLVAGEAEFAGRIVIGTVQGDLHDIGKNLVAMVMEGGGYEVVDLGVDVSAEKFMAALEEKPEGIVGLSALLTTTMVNMEKTVSEIKARNADTKVIVGGAPLTDEFAKTIGADAYAPDPQGCLDWLASA